MFRKIRIRKHEVGLWFRHGDFQRVLEPGVHWLPGRLIAGSRLERYDTLETQFTHGMLDILVTHDQVRDQLIIVGLTDEQRALVWKDGRLSWILGPGRYAFWKRPCKLDVETYDVNQFTFALACGTSSCQVT